MAHTYNESLVREAEHLIREKFYPFIKELNDRLEREL